MHSNESRGANQIEHPQRRLDWNLARIFLVIARAGSLRAAGDALGISGNSVRKHISKLEDVCGARLLKRNFDGVHLTEEGVQFLKAAERMEAASFGLERIARKVAAPEIKGEVKLSITEGLGTFWIAPRLVEFQRAYPDLLVDLNCEMKSADVLRLEADVSVQLVKPQQPDLICMRIGRLHIMPFVSPLYVDVYGMPKDADDIRANHRIVLQIAEQTKGLELYKQHAHREQLGFVAMRNNVSTAHLWSITKGAGIGWLPTYVPMLGDSLIPLNIGVKFELDIWLAYHPESKKIPRVERLINWTIESFDGRRFPWFRDDFVHPDQLLKVYRGEYPVNLFAGFTKERFKQASSR